MVSIIIPCYNSQHTILRALESVFNQTYKKYEIIIVDDGSRDDTQSVIQESMSQHEIKYIYQENQGPSKARNLGVENANGEYIAFLDADDEWHKDKLKIQMEIVKELSLDFLGSTYQYDAFDYQLFVDVKLKKYTFSNLLLKTRFSTPGVLISKKLFLEVGKFDESLKYAEDNDLWLRCSLKNDLYLIQEPKLVRLYKSAFGSSGLSSHMYSMFKGEIIVLEKLYKNKNLGFIQYNMLSFYLFLKLLRRYIMKKLQKGMV